MVGERGSGMSRTGNRELDCLEATRAAHNEFHRALTEHAREHRHAAGQQLSVEDVELLRSDYTYKIAQFYYSALQSHLTVPTRLRAFLQFHNEEMKRLIDSKPERDLLKLSVSSAQSAIFTPPNINNVIHLNTSPGPLVLNQKYLGSLLIEYMSRETCRKTIEDLEQLGLLTRLKIGETLIKTEGKLEKHFEKHLQIMADYLELPSSLPGKSRKRMALAGE